MDEISFEVSLDFPYEKAVDLVIDALKSEGFGVLTKIDVKVTIKEKLDKDFRSYIIIGACNPPLAHRALSIEPAVGLMLPCNVTVEDDISVKAKSSEDITSVAANLGIGGSAGISGAAGVYIITTNTNATISGTSVLTAGGDVMVAAQGDFDITDVAGQISAGGSAGIGISADQGITQAPAIFTMIKAISYG